MASSVIKVISCLMRTLVGICCVQFQPAFGQELPAIRKTNIEVSSGSNWTEIPLVLCNVKNVQNFTIANNLLSELPTCLANFASTLNYLNLRDNQIVKLPQNIGELKNLNNLELDGNKLTDLPTSIGNIESLTYLSVENNELVAIPDTIGNLENLSTLKLNGNELTKLPLTVGKITRLEFLYLSGNKLTKAPAFLPYLVNLKKLDLSNNLLSEPEKAAVRILFRDTTTEVIL